MLLRMDGLIINDEVYKLVEDGEDFDCKDCALEKYCGNFDTSICTESFITTANSCRHFEKVEKGDDKQSEIPNQTYFY